MNAGQEFIRVSLNRIDKAQAAIQHCLKQLSDEEVWHRIGPATNSIGIIINHICGNAGQWILSGIGGAADTRDRAAEFLDEIKSNKDALEEKLNGIIGQFKDTLKDLKEECLLEKVRKQGLEKSVMDSIYSTVIHLELHAGQITMLTHLMRKDRYVPTHEYKGNAVVKRNC